VSAAHRWRKGNNDYPIPDAVGIDMVCRPKLPRVLLGAGQRPDAFDAPRIAIVGTRAATPCGLADALELGAFYARAGITVVSGLAIGIDAAAHEGALDAGGLTVGVVATGLDVVYPRRHARLYERVRERGLIIGENENGTQPLPWRFPIRNRLIAALAPVLVVVEATRTGGALSSARYARDFGRHVYALPGSRRNPSATGCNELIRDGATPLLDPADVLTSYGCTTLASGGWISASTQPMSRDERVVLRACAGDGASIDDLERRCSLPADRMSTALRGLERAGRLVRRRGMWWPQ
jgi:DNA processing protein